MTVRDLAVMGGCLRREPTSLSAFWHVARLLPRAVHRRKLIMQRRRRCRCAPAAWTAAARCAWRFARTRFAKAALQSAAMDFDDVDRAPAETLNRIIWWSVKGFDAPYPGR